MVLQEPLRLRMIATEAVCFSLAVRECSELNEFWVCVGERKDVLKDLSNGNFRASSQIEKLSLDLGGHCCAKA